jgi:hypothetical protein
MSCSSFSAGVDQAMIKSMQAQMAQMQTIWSAIPNQINTMTSGIEELSNNCSQQNSKGSAYCLNASSYYNDYLQAVSQNASQDIIDKAYNNFLSATQQAASMMNSASK